MMIYDHCGLSDRGGDPDGNDDCLLMAPEMGLFLVADGMGGRPGGRKQAPSQPRLLQRNCGPWIRRTVGTRLPSNGPWPSPTVA